MNKSELVEALAARTALGKAHAKEVLEQLLEILTDTASRGEDVALGGFGTFKVTDRPERLVRNPRDGEKMRVAPSRTLRFRLAPALKTRLTPPAA